MPKKYNLVGQLFGRLWVLKRDPAKPTTHWLCRCICAKQTIKSFATGRLIASLKGDPKQGVQSCGCLRLEKVTKHGLWKDKAYGIWEEIVQRTTNPNNVAYPNYGGRGIKMCDSWRNDPKAFCDWYDNNLAAFKGKLPEVDRIDNEGDYTPENCRIASKTRNNRNKRTNFMVKFTDPITNQSQELCAMEVWEKFYSESYTYNKFIYRVRLNRLPHCARISYNNGENA